MKFAKFLRKYCFTEHLRTTTSAWCLFLRFSEDKKSNYSWIFTVIKFPVFHSFFYVISCCVILLRDATVTNTILIFLSKGNLNKKGNVWIQKRQYILKHTLDVFFHLESIFLQSHGYILFEMQCCCSKLDFQVIMRWILVDKNAMKWRKKIVALFFHLFFRLIIRGNFPFFNSFFKYEIKLFVLNQSMNIFLTESKAHGFSLHFSWRNSLWYRNQSDDLHCKLIDCFLNHRDLCHKRVKEFEEIQKTVRNAELCK